MATTLREALEEVVSEHWDWKAGQVLYARLTALLAAHPVEPTAGTRYYVAAYAAPSGAIVALEEESKFLDHATRDAETYHAEDQVFVATRVIPPWERLS